MTTASTARMSRDMAFPDELGAPVWQERRTFPVFAVYGVPLAFLAMGTVAVHALVLRLLLGAATVVAVALLIRARRRAVIEVYTLTDRFVAVEQPCGGRI